MKCRILIILLVIVCGHLKSQDSTTYSIRYLSANLGNVGLQCWESKLCDPTVANNFKSYIQTWSPDILLLSEVYKRTQLDSTDEGGPVLPAGYSCDCDKSLNRTDSLLAAYDAADASHEHECIAWKTAMFTMVPNSSKAVYGRNDAYGLQNCNYDFTAHSLQLVYNSHNTDTIVPVSLHPNSMYSTCRIYEIDKYWTDLISTNKKAIIAGDWNTDVDSELQVRPLFTTIFSKGHYWNLFYSSTDYSQTTFLSNKHLDHAFSNFGTPCTNCGNHYGTTDLQYGAALGGYNGHPRADGGSGMDHRQILIDMNVKYANTTSVANYNNYGNYIHLYPNPAKSSFIIEMTNDLVKNKIYSIEITDVLNKCVLKEQIELNNNKQEINIENLPDAFYFVRVMDNSSNAVFNYKLIKQH
jgi:hypothetical protein